jgi:hypothetical protein
MPKQPKHRPWHSPQNLAPKLQNLGGELEQLGRESRKERKTDVEAEIKTDVEAAV